MGDKSKKYTNENYNNYSISKEDNVVDLNQYSCSSKYMLNTTNQNNSTRL